MDTRIVVSLLSLVCLLLSACGKEAVEVDQRYVGYWYNPEDCEPGLRIEADGKATYNATRALSDCDGMRHSGTARISGETLRVGSKRLTIDQGPTPTDAHMVIWPGNGAHLSTMKVVLDGADHYRLDNY